ncbi:uncharacterized protein LOC116266454 [Nymphaea colorata]|uniref:uncharacterized protein LOC116266454 n=2 Tax=Nymphaea colorata TaxID=210225 RepID=UPI00214F0D76|nr:uncharacterized protein LOC116266454 [Nymphaea colorata]XP_049936861.1 uncharacterized protein LOC116266454 [Nymphaea colorata]
MSDPAWQWCTRVNPKNRLRVKCNYCKQIISGGISRFKHHIAGTHSDVAACNGSQEIPLPAYVKHQCQQLLDAVKASRIEKDMEDAEEGYGDPHEGEESEGEDVQLEQEDVGVSLKTTKGKGIMHGGGSSATRKRRGASVSSVSRGRGRSQGRTGGGRVPTMKSSNMSGSIKNFFPNYTAAGAQPEIRIAMQSKDIIEAADETIGRWFYDASIPFNAANSYHYQPIADAIASVGRGYKMPSFHKLRGKILNNIVRDVKTYCDELKLSWKATGCSVMADGWTDIKNRTLVNFLVYCPLGTMFLKSVDLSDTPKTADVLFGIFDKVIEEVGPENVVQFITDNAANYKAAGEMLAARYGTFYWSPCAAHCVNLMLQDLGERDDMKLTVHRCQEITKFIYNHAYVLNLMRKFTNGAELIRPAQTRFATNVLTVQGIVKQRTSLRQMFSSDDWAAYPHAYKRKATTVVDTIFDVDFWESCVHLLKICVPLVKVLRLVDSEDRPSIGYLYESMDRAKEAIRDNMKGKKKLYMPIWKIIDERWSGQLHCSLHAAAYYLNPAIRYLPTFKKDREVEYGMLDCIDVLVSDSKEQDAIHMSINKYDTASGTMARDTAVRCRTTMRPDLWWERFGPDCPELRKLAIRILSQTCSATGCERNWSVFQHIHSKKRNRLEHKRLNDLVYVRYNMKLRQRQLETTSTRKHHNQYDPIFIDHFDILDSWVEEEPAAILDEDDLDFLNVEGAAEIVEEGEVGSEQWNVGDIPFATEGIEEEVIEENEDDDEE